jgi:hypothetical protein
MDIITRLKQTFYKLDKSKKSAHVTFYPNQIIITTYDYTETGLGLVSPKLTKLPIDVSPDVLGKTLRKHFSLTAYNLEHPKSSEVFKKYWNEYKNAAGFKTNKETYKDAREISCLMSKTEIKLIPCENKYNTSYLPISDSETKLDLTISDQNLGIKLFESRKYATG